MASRKRKTIGFRTEEELIIIIIIIIIIFYFSPMNLIRYRASQ